MNLDDIKATASETVLAQIEAAYTLGFSEGKNAGIASVLQAAQSLFPGAAVKRDAAAAVDQTKTNAGENERNVRTPTAKRAPKGLTEATLKRVLRGNIALPMEEVQRRALQLEPSLSEKTVYNDLYRKPYYAKNQRGDWFLLPEQQLPLTEAPEERQQAEAPMH